MLYDEFLDCFVDNNIIERMSCSYLYRDGFYRQISVLVNDVSHAVNFSLWYHDVKGYVIRITSDYVYLIRNWEGDEEVFNNVITSSNNVHEDKIIFCLKLFLNKDGNTFGIIYDLK